MDFIFTIVIFAGLFVWGVYTKNHNVLLAGCFIWFILGLFTFLFDFFAMATLGSAVYSDSSFYLHAIFKSVGAFLIALIFAVLAIWAAIESEIKKIKESKENSSTKKFSSELIDKISDEIRLTEYLKKKKN